jgi:uncharacterized surface protein with fasciclin (FAS1) repeats
MKRKFWKQFIQQVLFLGALYLCTVSCKDQYLYDNKEPDWLGASIYDYLKSDGQFTYYTKLIDDLGYTEVLKKTGSKTLFVVNDSAFVRFFQNNPWGVKSYEGLTLAQKKLILFYNMIDNAYLIETLSNYNDGGALIVGQAMRRATGMNEAELLDSLPFEKGDQLPNGPYWQKYKANGLFLMKENSPWPMVHFLQKQMDNAGITDEDFQIMTGSTRNANDAYIFGNKIIKRDITCKNGYINVLQNVMISPGNMANYIHNTANLSQFSGLLERFCAPYNYPDYTDKYRATHPGSNDTIFAKLFFTIGGGGGANVYPDGKTINTSLLLSFDPGWSSYRYISASLIKPLQADMAAMFVPTNEAMNNYFNNGTGKILKERYQTWDNVPDDIIALLVKRHMISSFLASVPSRFPKLMDDNNYPVPAKKSDVVGSYIGINGLVYSINNVYSPPDYESVYAPVLFSEKTKVFNWAVIQNQFKYYLNSLESRYSFFVPTDAYLSKYIDPVTIAKDIPGALKFWYDESTKCVNATIYKYNLSTNELGDSVNILRGHIDVNGKPDENAKFIIDRLKDLLDSHVVVGDVESGQGYYLSKGGSILKVKGSGTNLTVEGGGDIAFGQKCNVVDMYNQTNGKTYIVDKPIQTPINSTYKILSTTPEFSEFFALLNGFQPTSSADPVIFVKQKNYYGIDYSIKFFNTFNYSVYVPTNAAIQEAISNKIIIPWISQTINGISITGINDMTDVTQRDSAISKLERFLRYHFQDNAVFISGNSVNEVYATATIKNNDLVTKFNTYKNKYYKIGITGSGNDLSLTTETGGTANVITQNGLYNIITRDYIFSADPRSFKEIDGTGGGTDYSISAITTSSTAVIHQIDHVLLFQ